MLGKYKGFSVPGKSNSSAPRAKGRRQTFCHKASYEDCQDIVDGRGKGQDCFKCLFFLGSRGDQKEAFEEWHKAKGKVEYDKEGI